MIAFFYTAEVAVVPLVLAVGAFVLAVMCRAAGVHNGAIYLVLGVLLWFALLESGVHATLAGVAMGMLATAYPPSRSSLKQAGSLWRSFREQPTSGHARSARRGIRIAIPPNERLQAIYHPWASYLIVPLFAVANAGVDLSREMIVHATTSPVTIGIVVALAIGKLVGITGASFLATRRTLGGLPLTVPWRPLFGTAAVAGIGFTVSLFIAEISFEGPTLEEAKLGIFAVSALAGGLSWLLFQVIARIPGPGAATNSGTHRR